MFSFIIFNRTDSESLRNARNKRQTAHWPQKAQKSKVIILTEDAILDTAPWLRHLITTPKQQAHASRPFLAHLPSDDLNGGLL